MWDDNSASRFQDALCGLTPSIDNYINTNYNEQPEGVDAALKSFNTIINTAAIQSLRKIRPQVKMKPKRTKWYGPNLRKMKSDLYKCGRLLCAYPYDPKLRGSYYKKLKQYKKLCKCEYRRFKSGIVNMLGSLQSNNPKQYWELVEDITNKNQPKTCVAVENLYEHYKNLNSDNVSSTNNRVYIEDRIREFEKVQNFTPLDFIITDTEISKSISKLKKWQSSRI